MYGQGPSVILTLRSQKQADPFPKTMISSAKIRPNEKHSPIFPHILGHCPAQTFSLPHSFRVVLGGLLLKKKIKQLIMVALAFFYVYAVLPVRLCKKSGTRYKDRSWIPWYRRLRVVMGCWEPNLNPLEE